MIERIVYKKEPLSIIIRANYSKEGIEFFTTNEFSQQLAYMKRPKGYNISPHLHLNTNKNIQNTQEVLLIRSGKVRVDFYEPDKKYFLSKILTKGDVILLAFGGHGFKILEESEIIEVKQGPYEEAKDKERFENTLKNKINIS